MIQLAIGALFATLYLILTPLSHSLPLLLSLISLSTLPLLLSFHKSVPKIGKYRLRFLSIGFIWGTLITTPHLIQYREAEALLPMEGEFRITVVEQNPNYERIRLQLLTAPNPALIGWRIDLYNPPKALNQELIKGSTLTLPLRITPKNGAISPASSSKRLRFLSQRVIGNGRILPKELDLEKIDRSPPSKIEDLRQKIDRSLKERGYPHAAELSALSVGITQGMSEEHWQRLRETGTIHLFSISGLHLTLVALWGFILIRTLLGLMLTQKLNGFNRPYQWAAVMALLSALLYALLAGFSLPTQRALMMFLTAMIALILRIKILSLSNLSFALLMLLSFSPFSPLTIGFWLSFGTVALLMLINNRFQLSPIPLLLTTQALVTLFVIPFTAHFFGELSLISFIANLIAIPFMTLIILPSLLIGLLLSLITPLLGHPPLIIADEGIRWLLALLKQLQQLPFASLTLSPPPLIASLLLALALLTPLFHLKRSIKSRLTLTLIVTALLSITLNDRVFKERSFLLQLPVNEGLATIIKIDKEIILFDTGSYFRGFESGTHLILPTIERLKLPPPSYLLISRDNQHHMGGFRTVRRRFPEALPILPPELTPFLPYSTSCKGYRLMKESFTLEAFNEVESSCAYRLTISEGEKRKEIWLLGDLTVTEWEALSRHPKPHLILAPNQGLSNRKPLFLDENPPLYLFSTRNIHPSFHPLLKVQEALNSYYGTIFIPLSPSSRSLKEHIHYFDERKRFWWLKRVEKEW